MKLKKVLTFLLAAQMLLASVACSESSKKTENAETTPNVETNVTTDAPIEDPETEPVDRNSISDDLPDITFGGKEFRLLSTEWHADMNGYFAEDYTGDPLNDAQFLRNQTVEKRFDVKLNVFSGPGQSHNDMLMYVQSDEDAADVVDLIQYQAGKAMGWGILSNWMQVPHINLEKPWWNKLTNNDMIFNNKAYFITGDYAISTLKFNWVLNFNYNLMEEFNYSPDQIYQLVFDGEWTIDKMFEICSSIYRDENGDGRQNLGDIYGYGTPTFEGTDGWITAIDARIVSKDDQGNLIVTLGEEKVYNTLEKLNKYFYSTKGVYGYSQKNEPKMYVHWKQGLLAMYPTQFQECYTSNQTLSFDYGILPYPKYDVAQKGYRNGAMDQIAVYGLPVTVPDDRYEFVGIIMEALMAESYKQVYPVYYEEALLGRAAEDENAYRCIDLIMRGRTYDMAFPISHVLEGLPYQFRYCLAENSNNLASKLAEIKPLVEEGIKKLNQFFIDDKPFMERPSSDKK